MNTEFITEIEGYRGRMRVLVRSIVGDDALAQDIVQDSVLAYLQAVSGGAEIVSPGAWLMRVARNRALDSVRSVGFSRASVLESAWRHDSGVDVENDLNMRERVGQVYSVVRQLPEQQRSVFILRDVLGYEMEEISDITGCGTDNVRQMLSRARKRIREYLMKNE